ncbi:hypothetical protein 10_00001 [Pseudomonas phage Epa10]|uniref:Uncharacterized protein n=1 Tax=Pseudomonas phage Epa10 TaxID=2719183 RepID=A0A6G9LGC8_9CAUD|nr:hypothetical protein 10_00001 [Pseudomonas phage Epa10]
MDQLATNANCQRRVQLAAAAQETGLQVRVAGLVDIGIRITGLQVRVAGLVDIGIRITDRELVAGNLAFLHLMYPLFWRAVQAAALVSATFLPK